jgi:hypothetical protein
MTKRIKHVSELPEWFDLDKYEFAHEIKFSGWYEQLYVRGMAFAEIMENVINNPNFKSPDDLMDLKNALQAVFKNPNIDLLCGDKRLDYFPLGGALYHVIKPENLHELLGLDSITLRDYASMEFFIDKDRLSYAKKWYDSPKTIPYNKLPSWMNEPLHQSYRGTSGYTDTLNIWLALPDEYLLETFKKYLLISFKNVYISSL